MGLDFLKKPYSRTVVGGAAGYGATAILHDAYFHFVKDYRPGDRMFIFGFSRGAAIARRLANYICSTHGLPGSVDVAYLSSSFLGMRTQKDSLVRFDVKEPLKWGSCDVELLGLWDTVTAFVRGWNSEDLMLPPGVKKAYHLVAIDEVRGDFDVTLIDQTDRGDRVEEIWFAGAHSNVGGGLKEHGQLSDITLHFMVSRALECGIDFDDKRLQTFQREFDRTKERKIEAKLISRPGSLWRWRRRITRQIGVQGAPGVVPRIHKSVFTLKDLPPNVTALGAGYTSETRD